MDFNYHEFIHSSNSNCRSKLDLIERIQDELESVSKIKNKKRYMDRLTYKHQLELTRLALKCGTLMNNEKYNSEITDLLNKLE